MARCRMYGCCSLWINTARTYCCRKSVDLYDGFFITKVKHNNALFKGWFLSNSGFLHFFAMGLNGLYVTNVVIWREKWGEYNFPIWWAYHQAVAMLHGPQVRKNGARRNDEYLNSFL